MTDKQLSKMNKDLDKLLTPELIKATEQWLDMGNELLGRLSEVKLSRDTIATLGIYSLPQDPIPVRPSDDLPGTKYPFPDLIPTNRPWEKWMFQIPREPVKIPVCFEVCTIQNGLKVCKRFCRIDGKITIEP